MANPTVLPNNMPGSAAKTRRPLLDFSKRFRNPILLILSIVLIILAIWLVSVLIAKTFSSIFTCNHLISKPLGTSILCDGVTFPHFNFWVSTWGHTRSCLN